MTIVFVFKNLFFQLIIYTLFSKFKIKNVFFFTLTIYSTLRSVSTTYNTITAITGIYLRFIPTLNKVLVEFYGVIELINL